MAGAHTLRACLFACYMSLALLLSTNTSRNKKLVQCTLWKVPGHQKAPEEAELSLPVRELNCRPWTMYRFVMVIRVTVCQPGEMSSLESLAQLIEVWDWCTGNPANNLAPSQTSQPQHSIALDLHSQSADLTWKLSWWAFPNSYIFGHRQVDTCQTKRPYLLVWSFICHQPFSQSPLPCMGVGNVQLSSVQVF